ncbi:ATP-binding protein [Streptomyces sp. NPDC002668]|uniref:ATP-binding protein n=1 Tax=Streptomyces sp. NPDC002668 TaxID=3154422 RepID=UPI003319AF27
MPAWPPSSTAVFGREVVVNTCFAVSPCVDRSGVLEDDTRRVSSMRRLVRDRLASCGLRGLLDDAELIVSELLTNSLLHSGGTEISLALCVVDDELRIRVGDGIPRVPHPPRQPGDDAESGRGLDLVGYLVNARHGAWGVSSDGRFTWCILSTAEEG